MSNLQLSPNPNRVRYDDETFPPQLEVNFAWTDRDDYLAWVASWKRELHERVNEIRALRTQRQDKARSIEDRNGAQYARQDRRIDCHNLFVIRQIGKRRSAEQRAKRLAA